MDELERAYLLSGEELLLLFSLLDSRPVVAFALPDPAQVPPAHWKQAGVGLCRKGLAAYTDAGLAPAEELAGLIGACKGADTVCLAFCRDADCKTRRCTGVADRPCCWKAVSGLATGYAPGRRIRTPGAGWTIVWACLRGFRPARRKQ